jgi:hypothetical protein
MVHIRDRQPSVLPPRIGDSDRCMRGLFRDPVPFPVVNQRCEEINVVEVFVSRLGNETKNDQSHSVTGFANGVCRQRAGLLGTPVAPHCPDSLSSQFLRALDR